MAEDSTEVPEKGDNKIPSMRMGEMGYAGTFNNSGNMFDACRNELRWPKAGQTYSKMSKDPTIFPALSNVESMVARVPWEVKVPVGYEEKLKKQANYLRTVTDDMEHSWTQFIRYAATFNTYGFSAIEKVFRRRLKSQGSKFNDGLVGIRKLAPRPQNTILDWNWKNKGRDLTHMVQATAYQPSKTGLRRYYTASDNVLSGGYVEIPRKKLLLFRYQGVSDSPWGQSPLESVWESWKYLKALKETEALGISQDSRGLKVLYLPPQYMADDAPDSEKAIYEYYKRAMSNMHKGTQTGLILPGIKDDMGENMFDFQLMSMNGRAGFDIDAVIRRYQVEILTDLMANFLSLGNTGGGSYALSDNLLKVAQIAIEARLIEIKDVLNKELVPHLFEKNGWDTSVTPYFDFGAISPVDLEEFTKGIQRISSTGNFYKTAKNINFLHKQFGFPDMIDENLSFEEVQKLLTPIETRASDGMKKGSGNGTSDSSSSRDNSTANNEN